MSSITIKLKPWLQEYLMCKLNDPTLNASNKNIIGALLTPFLEYTPKGLYPKNNKGKDYITFKLPNWLGKKDNRNGTVYISDENQKNFERILMVHFKDCFFSYIDDKIRYTKQIKICILQFCADHNISFNNITYEMLKKSYYRRKKSQKSTMKLSLSCPLFFV